MTKRRAGNYGVISIVEPPPGDVEFSTVFRVVVRITLDVGSQVGSVEARADDDAWTTLQRDGATDDWSGEIGAPCSPLGEDFTLYAHCQYTDGGGASRDDYDDQPNRGICGSKGQARA